MVVKKSTKKPTKKPIQKKFLRKSTKGKSTKGKSTKGKSTKGKSTKGKSTKGKSTKGKPTKGQEGYCVYYFAHRGIGQQIIDTKNMKELEKKLKKNIDVGAIGCNSDLKIAKKIYQINHKKINKMKFKK